MEKDEIIKIAIENLDSFCEDGDCKSYWAATDDELVAFAKLVAAKEREACAYICDESAEYQKKYLNTHAQGIANGCAISIRARGEA